MKIQSIQGLYPNLKMRLIIAIAGMLSLAFSINSAFVDKMSLNEFERLYKRADYMTTDFRGGDTQHFGDSSRYKRDFVGATRWQNVSYLIWRWPNEMSYDRLLIVTNTVAGSASSVFYSYSNDDITYTRVTPAMMTNVNSPRNANGYIETNTTINFPTRIRYFRVDWTPCDPNNICRNYWSPSLNHLCAIDTARGEVINDPTCFPAPRNPTTEVNPHPKYCGATVVADFWSPTVYDGGIGVNSLGGSMTYVNVTRRHNCPHEGIGECSQYLQPPSPIAPASRFSLRLGPAGTCFDGTGFTHFSMEVNGGAGLSFLIEIEEGTTANCAVAALPTAVNTSGYATFTAALSTQQIIIPLSAFGHTNLGRLRAINVRSFVNPTNQSVLLDNLYFNGRPFQSPVWIDRFGAGSTLGRNELNGTAGDGASLEVFTRTADGKLTLGPRTTGGYWYTNLPICYNILPRFPNPALKFDISVSMANTDFAIVIDLANPLCSPTATPRFVAKPRTRFSRYLTITSDNATLTYPVSIPLSNFTYRNTTTGATMSLDPTRMLAVVISEITPYGTRVTIDNLRFGSADCTEPEDPLRLNFRPSIPYVGFTRAGESRNENLRRRKRDEL
ncbi:hypothetical protein BKA69DRAFT_1081558 [Paraphysoderma sedebokerense]|nr:hypothetical protein BKA69DRAFT_1081558 [Paraphysoderma sedebokerense]